MKNRKRIKFGILIATIIAIAIIGTIGVKKMNEPTEKEKQIAFLKEHEEEMTSFIKENSSQDKVVKYYWNTVEKRKSMAFSKENLTIKFDLIDFNKTEKDNYYNAGNTLVIDTDTTKLDEINSLWTVHDIDESRGESE
ncbi:hypothetical protein CUM54_06070 [Enterococcus faecalis]|uniref:Uncharacterized protein n=1 Tax=Enterococcus faecalis TaxID=1351 RepID=A0A4U3K4H7_ENTFL|nr:hypothetical protein [Enterococcus faecalis]EEU76548.1 predicted protein [Enterococcus faecalis E1Sol]EGO8664206.1 hypothetical protein [Enterococcus faecalis]EGS8048651.1 hypothetical protein [Enterococcus faecalis]EHD3772995.1 hypothetical protein [Enterococcus faecalis]EIM5408131.1 hypothetical protein [Enterococcus faecalis]